MKNIIKKISTFLLVFLLLSLPITAFAEGEEATHEETDVETVTEQEDTSEESQDNTSEESWEDTSEDTWQETEWDENAPKDTSSGYHDIDISLSVPDGFTDDIELIFVSANDQTEARIFYLTHEHNYEDDNYIRIPGNAYYVLHSVSPAGSLFMPYGDEFDTISTYTDGTSLHYSLIYKPEEQKEEDSKASESETEATTPEASTAPEQQDTKKQNGFVTFMKGLGSFFAKNWILIAIVVAGIVYLNYRNKKEGKDVEKTIKEDKKDDSYIE